MTDNTSGQPTPSFGGITDLVSTIKGAVRNIAQLNTSLKNARAFAIGTTTAINNLGTTSTQVLPVDSTRISVLFHNPSDSVVVLVAPNAVASFTARGGSFLILPQDSLPLAGSVQVAWNAAAQSGTTNPLTISTVSQN